MHCLHISWPHINRCGLWSFSSYRLWHFSHSISQHYPTAHGNPCQLNPFLFKCHSQTSGQSVRFIRFPCGTQSANVHPGPNNTFRDAQDHCARHTRSHYSTTPQPLCHHTCNVTHTTPFRATSHTGHAHDAYSSKQPHREHCCPPHSSGRPQHKRTDGRQPAIKCSSTTTPLFLQPRNLPGRD